MLSSIDSLAKKSIYTNGPGISETGISGVAVKNELTKETVISGGALTIADNVRVLF